jgi:hypothetical protein
MDWFKQNPFLGGLAAGTLVAVLGAGYFLFSSLSRFEEEASIFEEETRTLARLQDNKPFPNEANVELTREELVKTRQTLEEIGSKFAVTPQNISPQAFQDRLRQMVTDIETRAKEADITLGDNFYLGFETYATQLPPADATGRLLLQLEAIHAATSILVDTRVRAINSITRPELAAAPADAPADRRGRPQPADDGDKESLPDVGLIPFDINFITEQTPLRLAFNRLLEAKPPVFVRLVAVTNSSPAAPQKQAAETAQTEAGALQPVLGREVLDVTFRLASVGPAHEEDN